MGVTSLGGPSGRAVAGKPAYLVIHNTSEVVTPDPEGRRVLRYPKGAIAFAEGRVLEVGGAVELLRRHADARPMNANGRLVTPGLVDCHTHMMFGGNRADEFQRRLAGEDYAAIAAKGGGIHSTVRATRAMHDDMLEKLVAARLERWRANGCTTVEVKSGYSLTPRGEIRLLELMRAAAARVPVRTHRTALLLHAIPEEFELRRREYLEQMAGPVLEEIVKRNLASAVDVFCDDVAFSVEECGAFLRRARDRGMAVKLHADQLSHTGGAALAAELGALSADHLESATPEDWEALAKAGVTAVLLPVAALTLKQRLPEAGLIRVCGTRVAIATDFNPGTSPAQSLLECGALAARLCGFSAEEILLGLTYNAACALGVQNEVGHLNPGAWGDAVLWECETMEELAYWMPAVRPDCVFMRGADLALPSVERRVWP